MTFNKEKIVCVISGAMLVLGIVFTVGAWPGGNRNDISLPPVDETPDVPRFSFPELKVLGPEFKKNFSEKFPVSRTNPFQAESGRRTANPADYPLPKPWEKPVGKNIPVPGTLGDERFRGILHQESPPIELEGVMEESGDDSEDEIIDEEIEDEEEEEDEELPTPPPPRARQPKPAPQPPADDEDEEDLDDDFSSDNESKADKKDDNPEGLPDFTKMSREEIKEYFKSLSPEEREAAMRELQKLFKGKKPRRNPGE